jgi:hypothetical protein
MIIIYIYRADNVDFFYHAISSSYVCFLCLIQISVNGENTIVKLSHSYVILQLVLQYVFTYKDSVKIGVMLYNLVPYQLTNDLKRK